MSLRSVSLRSVSLRSVSLRTVSLGSISLRSVSLRSVSLRRTLRDPVRPGCGLIIRIQRIVKTAQFLRTGS